MTTSRSSSAPFKRAAFGLTCGTVAIAACAKPEISACEEFVKGGLRAPATYRRVSLETRDERVTWDEYLRESPSDRGNEMLKRAFDLGQERRIVSLTYDAQNGFGVPVRNMTRCAFRLSEGKLANRNLKTTVRLAIAQRELRQSVRRGELPNIPPSDRPLEPAYPCCQ